MAITPTIVTYRQCTHFPQSFFLQTGQCNFAGPLQRCSRENLLCCNGEALLRCNGEALLPRNGEVLLPFASLNVTFGFFVAVLISSDIPRFLSAHIIINIT